MIHVTEHAIDRYCERVANLPRAEVLARLTAHAPAVKRAADFECHTVKCNGYKLVLCGERVVTVLAREHINRDAFPPMRPQVGAMQ